MKTRVNRATVITRRITPARLNDDQAVKRKIRSPQSESFPARMETVAQMGQRDRVERTDTSQIRALELINRRGISWPVKVKTSQRDRLERVLERLCWSGVKQRVAWTTKKIRDLKLARNEALGTHLELRNQRR